MLSTNVMYDLHDLIFLLTFGLLYSAKYDHVVFHKVVFQNKHQKHQQKYFSLFLCTLLLTPKYMDVLLLFLLFKIIPSYLGILGTMVEIGGGLVYLCDHT